MTKLELAQMMQAITIRGLRVSLQYPSHFATSGEQWAKNCLAADAEIIEGKINTSKHYIVLDDELCNHKADAVVRYYNGRLMSYWFKV